jgi:hypothetical protein
VLSAFVVLVGACGGSTLFQTSPLGEGVTQDLASAPAAADRVEHTGTRLATGDILIAGGVDANGSFVADAELFVRLGQLFEAGGTLGVPRAEHTATLLASDRVLLCGGQSAAGVEDTSELYDDNQNSFTPGPALAAARTRHTATRIKTDEVLVCGGEDVAGAPIGDFEVFEPSTGSFRAGGALQVPRSRHAAVFAPTEDSVFVFGGLVAGGGVTATVEILDPGAGAGLGTATLAAGNLLTARRDHAAVVLPDGRIVILGGVDAQGNTLADAEIYDPVRRQSSPVTGGLNTARARPRAALVLTGRVLVTGGGGATELFDSQTSLFSAAASLQHPRDRHTLTVFGTEVLLFGGTGQADPAELFIDF